MVNNTPKNNTKFLHPICIKLEMVVGIVEIYHQFFLDQSSVKTLRNWHFTQNRTVNLTFFSSKSSNIAPKKSVKITGDRF